MGSTDRTREAQQLHCLSGCFAPMVCRSQGDQHQHRWGKMADRARHLVTVSAQLYRASQILTLMNSRGSRTHGKQRCCPHAHVLMSTRSHNAGMHIHLHARAQACDEVPKSAGRARLRC